MRRHWGACAASLLFVLWAHSKRTVICNQEGPPPSPNLASSVLWDFRPPVRWDEMLTVLALWYLLRLSTGTVTAVSLVEKREPEIWTQGHRG